ncbi:MAG TPA: hemerythrin domain-containing protein [Candidatus Limnocylindrales bacterium]|nr:hemerythrin domain-containing protein [Candidatus Limnocylindrales bacterium]
MNAITMLTEDHREVERMLDELEPTTERAIKTRAELFTRIKDALTVHEVIEEEIFYPALRDHPKAKDIVLEAYEEHNVVDSLLGELERMPVDAETWGAKAKVMIENLRHHIEEEEGEMFPAARRVFDADELTELGERMAARRKSAERELAAAGSR